MKLNMNNKLESMLMDAKLE